MCNLRREINLWHHLRPRRNRTASYKVALQQHLCVRASGASHCQERQDCARLMPQGKFSLLSRELGCAKQKAAEPSIIWLGPGEGAKSH